MTSHIDQALQLCQKPQVEYASPEIDILLAECNWMKGNLDEAMDSLRILLKKRISFRAAITIRAHEVLYRILLQKQDYEQIIELLKDSINWLPEEYAKDGFDAMQAKKKLKERLKRFVK